MSEHDKQKLVAWAMGAVMIEVGTYLTVGVGGILIVTGLWFMMPKRYVTLD